MGWKGNEFGMSENPTFNQAQLFVTRLDELSGMIDECLTKNDLSAAFRLTKRIYRRISYKLKKESDKVLFDKTYEEHMKNVEDGLQRVNNFLTGNSSLQKLNHHQIAAELDEVDKTIWDLQWDLELVMKKKDMMSFEEEVENDFR